MNKIVLYGHGGSGNRGCEAIVRSTAKILRNNGIHTAITLGTFRKDEDRSIHLEKVVDRLVLHKKIKRYSFIHIKNVALKRLFKYDGSLKHINSEIISELDENTLAISIGGDNYYYGYPGNWMYINQSCKKRNVQTVLWGCSIEPDILRNIEIIEDMGRYDLITPRESITYEALILAGITKNTHLFPDPAFILDKIDLPLPDGFVENNTVGLNVSPLIMGLEKSADITYKNFAALIGHIIETSDMQIALIPHVAWETNNDLEPLAALHEQFKNTGRVCLIGDQYNCMELKGFISRCRMFVGARTHATIAAYSTCVPTLVVGYSVKARGIATDIFGSEDNMVIPVQSLENEDDLVKAFKYMQENEGAIRKHLQDFMPAYIEKTWLAGEEIRKLEKEHK